MHRSLMRASVLVILAIGCGSLRSGNLGDKDAGADVGVDASKGGHAGSAAGIGSGGASGGGGTAGILGAAGSGGAGNGGAVGQAGSGGAPGTGGAGVAGKGGQGAGGGLGATGTGGATGGRGGGGMSLGGRNGGTATGGVMGSGGSTGSGGMGIGSGGSGPGGVGGSGTGGMGGGGSGTGGSGKGAGVGCGATGECQAGLTCLDGVCCQSATCGPCLNCGSTGSCNVAVSNAEDSTGMVCSGTKTCDATGTCQPKPCKVNGCGARMACVSMACSAARRMFITSAPVGADFGGAHGADIKCQQIADAGGFGGTWMAWVSDSSTSPATRFTKATVPYRLLDGTLVATDWTALTRGPLSHGVNQDEAGAQHPTAEVWTATGSDGNLLGTATCSNFTSTDSSLTGVVGNSDATDANWTVVFGQFCDRANVRLYCVEQ